MLRNPFTRTTFAFLALLFAISPAQAKRDKLLDLSFQGPQLFSYERLQNGTARVTSQVPRLLGVPAANVLLETYAGYSSAGDLLDISGNGRDLADAGTAPTIVNASLMGADGNQLQAYAYAGVDGRHQLAHAAWMNIFDGDFTLTQVFKTPASNPGVWIKTFSHGQASISGFFLEVTNIGTISASLGNSTLTPQFKNATSSTYFADGVYHVVQVVRNGLTLSLYIDGIAVAATDLANAAYGIDTSKTMYIGCYDGPAGYYTQPIAYTRLQDSALTYAQIQKENDLFKGILGSRAPFQYASPTFQRSTASYGSRATGSMPLYQVPANWPVKTSDGGMLVEASFSQLFTYTGAFSTNWGKTRSSIDTDSVTLPDGTTGTTNVLHEDATAANDHYLQQGYSATSGTTYTNSLYVKYNGSAGTPREWIKFYISDGTNNKAVFFNVRYGYAGTASGTLTGEYGITPVGNSWYRAWVWATAGATATGYAYYAVADADNDITVDGQNQDSYFIAFPQLQTGAFPTSYYPQPAAAGAVRSADNLTYIPWRISDDLASHVNATPRLLFTGGESLAGATVTPMVGSYSFTKNGRPQNDNTYAEGTSFKLNGTSDYLSSASADFAPVANSFTVVATFTPLTSTGTEYIVGKSGAAGNRGWVLYQNGTGVSAMRSVNGTDLLVATVSASLEIGKPVLATMSFDSATGLKLYVDDFATASEATLGNTFTSSADFAIGAGGGGLSYFTGKEHYVAYYHGYAATEAEHDAMYQDWKSDGILPLNISSTAAKTKLIVECEVKGQYASATDNGAQYRSFLSIGGAYGTSSATRNNFYLQSTANGSSYAVLHTDGSITDRYIYSAVRTDHDKWTRHKWVVDTTELANSTYHINGVLQGGYTQMTGTAEFGLRDTLIRFGQAANGVILGNMEIRNVKLGVE